MLQCPLHIYSIFALRAANERYLEGGTTEQEWGFGQIAAVVLLGENILQIMDGVVGKCLSRVRIYKTNLNKEYRKTEVLNTALQSDEERLTANQIALQDATPDRTYAGPSYVEGQNVASGSTCQAQ